MHATRTMANLLATMNAPTSKLNFDAAICDRAARITARVMPKVPQVHGFYNARDFAAAMRISAARNQFYRDTFACIARKELLRGRTPPRVGSSVPRETRGNAGAMA